MQLDLLRRSDPALTPTECNSHELNKPSRSASALISMYLLLVIDILIRIRLCLCLSFSFNSIVLY